MSGRNVNMKRCERIKQIPHVANKDYNGVLPQNEIEGFAFRSSFLYCKTKMTEAKGGEYYVLTKTLYLQTTKWFTFIVHD